MQPSCASICPRSFSRQRWPNLILLTFASLLLCIPSFADPLRGTLIRQETLHVAPSDDAARLSKVGEGQELVVMESSRDWVHVQAIIMQLNQGNDEIEDEDNEPQTVTGWLPSKAVVMTTTPDGDKIVFGEAVDAEDQASSRIGQRKTAQDALRLYYRVYDLFPNSPLAGEGLYRAADIRWQIEREDIMTRPSARERQAYMRGQMNEEWMKLVMKKFPGTKWADMAAFHLIQNKLCGDWQGLAKCPDKEADMYEKYASEHPQSPNTPEALYDAAWRRSALIEIYKNEPNQKKAEESKNKALELAQKVVSQYGQTDWGDRSQLLIFMIQAGVPTYGETE